MWFQPIPLVARSKAWVCDRSHSGIEGSNSVGRMDVYCECCVLSGRCLCDGLITTEWCVCVCVCEFDHEPSIMRRPWPTGGCCAKNKQTNSYVVRILQVNPLASQLFFASQLLK